MSYTTWWDTITMLPRKPATEGQPADLTTFAEAVERNRTTLEDAAVITGLSVDDLRKAAAWIAEPKTDGARRRTMFAYGMGLMWGNDNYRTNGALANLAPATSAARAVAAFGSAGIRKATCARATLSSADRPRMWIGC